MVPLLTADISGAIQVGQWQGAERVFPYWAKESCGTQLSSEQCCGSHTLRPQSPLIIIFETTDSCSRYTTEIMSKHNSNKNHFSLKKNRNLVLWDSHVCLSSN